ncbi:MAG: MBL fold metallo-hydrolase [Eubacteriaceae bacterium]|jgi:glyoxylase-like metal-dependent hydrolase (beta-lactamase superfamily II)|nr:MBL fold metallo-hydrolase [Eubacteriaceae bacterium]
MRLTENIYLVASGWQWGFGLTDAIDCNVYMINTGDGCVLIDAGAGLAAEKMDAVIESEGFHLADIKAVILTHYHGDHACGAARIQGAAECPVYAPAKEAEAIACGDEEATSLAGAKGVIYPADFQYPQCPYGVTGLEDREELQFGNVTMKMFMIPGHSLCDMVISTVIDGKKCLFSGDAVFSGGQIMLQSLYDVQLYPYGEIMQELSELETDALFPGHGIFCLEHGNDSIKKAADKFAVGLIPPQLYYFV